MPVTKEKPLVRSPFSSTARHHRVVAGTIRLVLLTKAGAITFTALPVAGGRSTTSLPEWGEVTTTSPLGQEHES